MGSMADKKNGSNELTSGYVSFDPKIGEVEQWNIWGDGKTILKDYKYRDMLSKGVVIKK